MAYTILVNEDNTLYGSKKERIMQRSKCVDTLTFVVHRMYKGIDMTDATVVLEYLLPVSKKYETEYLTLLDERYNDCFLQYKLPFDTKLTSEAGSIELQLTFAYTDLDTNGNGVQKVRKTSSTTIEIVPISAWSDIIPDSALSAIDQRILKQDAQIKALNELANAFEGNVDIVDNLMYNDEEETLQLMAGDKGVGNKVSIKDMLDEGTPVVDLNSTTGDKPNTDDDSTDDNVVEF